MPGFATTLARDVCRAGSASLSAELADLARLHVADTLIAAMAGARLSPIGEAARALGHGSDPSGLPPAMRALGLAVAAHALQADDGDRAAGTHPGCVVVPAVWAVRQAASRHGDVTMAVALGYRVAAIIAGALPPARMKGGWHRTPVACVFGAAAAAGWLIGIRSEAGVRNVLCIAASLAAGILPSYQPLGAMEGTHPGLAAEAGVRAAALAEAGLVANDQALDGERGYLAALSDAALPHALDPDMGLPTSYLKRYGCVRAAQEPIDALLRSGPEVERIDLRLSAPDMRFSGGFPRTRVDAALNIAYCLAVVLVKGGGAPEPADFDDAMRRRVSESGIFERIAVRLSGGAGSSMTIHAGAGSRAVDLDVGTPTTWAELIRKWDGLLAYGDASRMELWDLPDARSRGEALAFLEGRLGARIGSGFPDSHPGE